jgi:GNAT superfamily N-acetyltransferase
VPLNVSPLNDSHNLENFRSGKPELDSWLRNAARSATLQGTRTYVLADEANTVAGYFAIAPHVVRRVETPAKLGRGGPREIPSILLAKLALSENLQGTGLGSELLVRALGTIIDAARVAGGKLIVVDAIDTRAAAFYRQHDFAPLPQRPDRLIMKISTASRALSQSWP